MSKVESIFGARRRGKFGCGFLAQRDVEEMLEGKLADSRRERFDVHLREGCSECLHLSAAIEEFQRVLDKGALGIEAEQFAETEHALKLRVREEFERTFAERGRSHTPPWGREISTDELEQIVAAGPDSQRNDEAGRDPDDPEES
jgi:hypothetical protein